MILDAPSDLVFNGRLGLVQRVLPAYRVPFFEALAGACSRGLGVFAGQPTPGEAIQTAGGLRGAEFVPAHNRHFLAPDSSFYLCWQAGITRWLESWQPDALVVEANPRYLSTRMALRWMHSRRLPVLGWGLGAPTLGNSPFARLRNWERLSFLRGLDGVLAYSEKGRQEYLALGLDAHRVWAAPNAVAPRPTAPPVERPEAFSGAPTVLFVGRLQRRKRLDNLLQACAALPEGLQPRLILVGDGPARGELSDLAQQVYPQAEFPGAQHGADLDPFFEAADLFVLPGTGGLAVQQAMAHGLPVVVAQGDGTQDDLVRPQNGWLIPPEDEGALVRVLREALSDPQRLRRMGAASFRRVSEEVNLEAMLAVFVQALTSVQS
jgi:glycosyltransferase involved in cell wall biosynthesis